MPINHHVRTFEEVFSPESLEAIYEKKIVSGRGGGRDHLSPEKFGLLYPEGFNLISEQCISNVYTFSPYKETLCQKGRGKVPRVLSIPTVRDKIVLSALTNLLQEYFPCCVEHRSPNTIIREIKKYLPLTDNNSKYYKGDIEGFYDHIDHELLMQKISSVVSDRRILSLISNAILTPTLADGESKGDKLNKVGIPQGLPLSNILAEIYMQECDEEFSRYASFYYRYVDDLLFMNVTVPYISRKINGYFVQNLPGLKLSQAKSHLGVIGKEEVPFIGYSIIDKKVSVKTHNLEKKIRTLAEMCRRIHLEEQDPSSRPLFIKDDDNDFYEYYQELFNETISGLKYDGRLYGWVPYFRELTDLSVLYRLDKILRKLLKRYVAGVDKLHINSFVASYYEVNQRGQGKLIKDFDKLTTVSERKAFLNKKGKLRKQNYTDQEINRMYHQYCRMRVSRELKNIGNNS